MSTAAASKVYRADSLSSALAEVRKELGPDAIIISAKEVQQSGILGIGKSRVEICASKPRRAPKISGKKNGSVQRISPHVPPAVASKSSRKSGLPSRRDLNNEVLRLRSTIGQMREEVKAARMESMQNRDNTDAMVSKLNVEISSASSALRNVLAEARLSRRTGLPDAQVSVIRQLVDNGVEPGIAEATVRGSLQNADSVSMVRRAVAEFLMAQIRTSPAIENSPGRHVVAFVGPTGVGKTTTIAKIAAACTVAGRRVGLVTTDTYRIAAVDQLRSYADLMGLRLEVANSPQGVRDAVSRLNRCSVILVDTAGRSPRASVEIDKLSGILSRAWISQTHLVLSASMGPMDLRYTYNSFKRVGIDRVDWTKLDESSLFGSIYNGQFVTQRPTSYLCAGQRVPEDLEAATPERITRLLLTTSGEGR